MAVLAAEERLTRADVKRDLLGAEAESLQPNREAFNCRQALPATAAPRVHCSRRQAA